VGEIIAALQSEKRVTSAVFWTSPQTTRCRYSEPQIRHWYSRHRM